MSRSNCSHSYLSPLFLLLLLLFTLPLAAQEFKRILVVETMTLPGLQLRTGYFEDALAKFGYINGENTILEVINIEKEAISGAQKVVTALQRSRPHLVVSVATLASQVTQKVLQGRDIPQIFFFVSDPVGAHLITQLEQPSGANITGFIHSQTREDTLNTVISILGINTKDPWQLAMIHTDYPSSLSAVKGYLEVSLRRPEISFIPIETEIPPTQGDIEGTITALTAALKKLPPGVKGIWIAEGPFGRNPDLVRALHKASPLPLIFAPNNLAVRHGVLLSISSDPEEEGFEAALLANAVLSGEDAGAIPVMRHQVSKITAHNQIEEILGITIPERLREEIEFCCETTP
ncbi:MAG: hypothetical protein HQL48_04065 [Gammaproteobacteria bacterium]|nr:hypothetical protein [Gammaproteobacteria bacterium]